jgi:hypothetical protein
MREFKLIALTLTDFAWLECLCDIEDLGAPPELLSVQLKCRPHLKMEKRALGLEHLKLIN